VCVSAYLLHKQVTSEGNVDPMLEASEYAEMEGFKKDVLMLKKVAVCCSVLQCVAVCAVCCSVMGGNVLR